MTNRLFYEFLQSLISREPIRQGFTRFSRAKLKQKLTEFIEKQNLDYDPILLFEQFEMDLPKSELIAGHHFHYNMYRQELTIEYMPTLEQLRRIFEIYSKNLRNMIIEHVVSLNYTEFERLISEVFVGLPWTSGVIKTNQSHDGGVDFHGTCVDNRSGVSLRFIGEVKRLKSEVGASAIRDFIGALVSKKPKGSTIGIYVSFNGFSSDAMKTIENSPVTIYTYDLTSLVDLMIKHKVGVKAFRFQGKVLDDQFWNEITD